MIGTGTWVEAGHHVEISGNSRNFHNLAFTYRVSHSSIVHFVPEVCEAIGGASRMKAWQCPEMKQLGNRVDFK